MIFAAACQAVLSGRVGLMAPRASVIVGSSNGQPRETMRRCWLFITTRLAFGCWQPREASNQQTALAWSCTFILILQSYDWHRRDLLKDVGWVGRNSKSAAGAVSQSVGTISSSTIIMIGAIIIIFGSLPLAPGLRGHVNVGTAADLVVIWGASDWSFTTRPHWQVRRLPPTQSCSNLVTRVGLWKGKNSSNIRRGCFVYLRTWCCLEKEFIIVSIPQPALASSGPKDKQQIILDKKWQSLRARCPRQS